MPYQRLILCTMDLEGWLEADKASMLAQSWPHWSYALNNRNLTPQACFALTVAALLAAFGHAHLRLLHTGIPFPGPCDSDSDSYRKHPIPQQRQAARAGARCARASNPSPHVYPHFPDPLPTTPPQPPCQCCRLQAALRPDVGLLIGPSHPSAVNCQPTLCSPHNLFFFCFFVCPRAPVSGAGARASDFRLSLLTIARSSSFSSLDSAGQVRADQAAQEGAAPSSARAAGSPCMPSQLCDLVAFRSHDRVPPKALGLAQQGCGGKKARGKGPVGKDCMGQEG
eukprot:359019-Chlamydomonas_euryale.AAC.4